MRARLIPIVLTVLFTFPAFAAITGTLINGEGQPVAGAKVSAFALESFDARRTRLRSTDPVRKALATAQSDSKGNFSIEAAKGSVVDLRFDAAGFAPQNVRAAADDDAGVIQMSAAQMKSGTITANGKPLAGAVVLVANEDGESWTTTDATGRYTLPDPARVNSRVIVHHPDYAIAQQSVGRFSASKTDIALDAGTALNGRVVAEDGTTAVPNAMVLVDQLALATTAADGTFAIAHMPKKWEQLEVVAGNRIASRAFAKDIASPLQLRLTPGASLTGGIRDAKTQLPLAGAEVRLTTTGRFMNTAYITAITDEKGNYAITGINGGDYDVTATRPNYSIVNVTAHLIPGQKGQKFLYGTPLGRIAGTVVDEDRRGVAAARVEPRQVSNDQGMRMPPRVRFDDRNQRIALTAPDGRFLLRVDTENDLQLEAMKKGQPNARSSTLKVAAGERRSGVMITLPRGIAVTGKVMDSNGKPISGVAVAATEARSGGGGPGGVRRMIINNLMRGPDDDVVRTASDGTFTLRVKEGSYDLIFKRDGYAAKTLRAQQVSTSSTPLEVTLEPGVEITGRVTRGGMPVEGVNVFPIAGDTMLPVQTGPDGRYRIGDLAPGEMMLAFNKREDFIQTTRAATAPAADVNVELPPGGRISGHVVDKRTHQPVKVFEAGVSPSRSGGGMMMVMSPDLRNFTSDDGSFALENVPIGALTLTVSAPGYVQTRVPNITLETGKGVDNIEVTMETGVRVTGKVTGPDGTAAGGAVVRLDDMANGRMMRGGGMNDPYTVTDPNGEYTLENVEPGEKTLMFSRSGLLPTSKTVTLSGEQQRVDAQLSSGVRGTGVVVTESGAPVADAQVHARSASEAGWGRTIRSDANGVFSFESLAPGHYEFVAQKDGYADAILRDVDVTTAGTLRLTLKSGGIITGHVSGLTATELQSAQVNAYAPDGNASAPVDSNGNYRIEGAPLGTVRVTARSGQMMSMRSAAPKSVNVQAGSAVTVDFDFASGSTIGGRVTRNGQPVAGASINFSGGGRNGRTSTDSNGRYEMTGFDDGRYTVMVMDPNRGPYTTSYTVDGSATFDIDIRGTVVRGRVIDTATGAPLADVSVSLRRKEANANSAGFPVSMGVSDAGGNFAFDSIPAGTYRATGELSGYGSETNDVSVGDNGADVVELKMTPSPGITLRVVDARDQRALSAWYHAVSSTGEIYDDFIRVMASSTEPVKIPLAAGSYRVTIGASGYATRSFTMNSPGSQTIGLTPGGTIVVSTSVSGGARGRLLDEANQAYGRGGLRGNPPTFRIEGAPLQSTLENIAPGSYTIQLLDDHDAVLKSTRVTVEEGRAVTLKL